MKTNNFAISIRVLLLTTMLILVLNFICAKGGGVELLVILGQVTADQTNQKSQIVKGVNLMQWIIKIVAAVGVSTFVFYLVKGWKKTIKEII